MERTIAAIATPNAPGGISVVRISGAQAVSIAQSVFHSASGRLLSSMKGYTAAYGTVWDGDEPIDEAVALVFHAPKSYTGEEVVELSCHGGLYVTRRLLRAVIAAGASPAQPGEFTRRAFENGKLSLTQAEAVMDLIAANSRQAANSAQAMLEGALYRKIKEICGKLLTLSGHLSAWADYPEEEIPLVDENELLSSLKRQEQALGELLASYDAGKLIREGISTAIVGKPNVGKSTLMNLLAGCEKSIVTEIAGTTRDVVEESVLLGDVVLRLADTAGIRDTDDRVEQAGVALSRKKLSQADLVLAVFDWSSPLTREDEELMRLLEDKPVIAVVNKSDLPGGLQMERLQQHFQHIVIISAKNTDGILLLSKEIETLFSLGAIGDSGAVLANERQYDCTSRAVAALREAVSALEQGFTLDAVDISLETALDALLELTGERVTDAVVDQVFAHFCVGK